MEQFFKVFLVLGIFDVCFAACRDPVLLSTWPLGFGDGVMDSETGIENGTIGADVTYEQGPLGVGSSSLQFNGGADSYVDFRVDNRSELYDISIQKEPDFSISMYLYVDDASSGTLFHYVSTEYSDASANDDSDIKQIKVFIEMGEIVVDYGAGRITSIVGAVLAENEWIHFVFSRDFTHGKTYVYLNRNSTKFTGDKDYGTVQNRVTQFPGHIRVGNSFNTIAAASGPLSGRVMCLKFFAMKDPTWLCYDTDKDCSTGTIVTTTSSSPSTTTTTTTTTITATIPPTITTTMPPTTSTTTTFPITIYTVPEDDACARFVLAQTNVTLMASPDIFDVMNVSEISACANACLRMHPCRGFVATAWGTNGEIECKLSYNVTRHVHMVGHDLWKLL